MNMNYALIFILTSIIIGCSNEGSQLNTPPNNTICTQDAMVCQDGHTVGRSGPKCEFNCNVV